VTMSHKMRKTSVATITALLLVLSACKNDEAATRAETQKAREGVTLTSCHSDRVINKIMIKPVVTIKNTTDEPRSYFIVVHVTGSDGTRLGKSNLVVKRVEPGKSVKRNSSVVQITEKSWTCDIKFVEPEIVHGDDN
jgi:hypothetical protein